MTPATARRGSVHPERKTCPEQGGYVRNSPLRYTDPTGHCASNSVDAIADDIDCWQQYDDLYNQFLLNGYSEEDILNLIGTGEAYKFLELGFTGIVGLYDSFRNCGSGLGCSNNSTQTSDPYANPCGWQYWQNCYEPAITRDEITPDAVIGGVSGSAGGIWYGVVGGEILLNIKSGKASVFSYAGQGAGVALEADTATYGGLVWNLEENINYEGEFSTVTVDLGVLVGVQFNFFWSTDTSPFTGETWGFSVGPANSIGFAVVGTQTNFTCQFWCN